MTALAERRGGGREGGRGRETDCCFIFSLFLSLFPLVSARSVLQRQVRVAAQLAPIRRLPACPGGLSAESAEKNAVRDAYNITHFNESDAVQGGYERAR